MAGSLAAGSGPFVSRNSRGLLCASRLVSSSSARSHAGIAAHLAFAVLVLASSAGVGSGVSRKRTSGLCLRSGVVGSLIGALLLVRPQAVLVALPALALLVWQSRRLVRQGSPSRARG
jgi:hypothetical protein